MFSLKEVKKAHFLEWSLLIGLLLFTLVFRVSQMDRAFFGPEQAWIAHASWKLANLQEFPTHMFDSSAGYSLFPLLIYLTFIPYLFTDSAFGLLVFFVLMNLLAVGLCGWFTRRYWGQKAALVAVVVYASTPWAIIFSLRIWNNTLLPPFVMFWAVGCGLAFAERRLRWCAIAWATAWLAVQLHVSSIFLLVITSILTWQVKAAHRWRYALLGSALGLLPTLPWLYALFIGDVNLGLDFGTATGQMAPRVNVQELFRFLSALGLAAEFIAASPEDLAAQLPYRDVVASLWLVLYGFAASYGIVKVWRARLQASKQSTLFSLLVLWFVLPLAYTLVSGERYTIVFFLPMLPAPCILLALAIQGSSQRHRMLNAIILTLVFVSCGLNLFTMHSLDRALAHSVEQGDATSHQLADDWLAHPPPLVQQLELADEIQMLFDSGDAAELMLLTEALPDEDHRRFSWIYSHHLRRPDVRVINTHLQHWVYPAQTAAILHDTFLIDLPSGYVESWQEQARLGPYRIYLLPGGSGPEPQYDFTEQPGYANGLQLIGYDELRCAGIWQLHWTPGPASMEGDPPAHFFVHLLDDEGQGLAHLDLRAYDVWDWRQGDHIVTEFDFGQELTDLPITVIRVGLYLFSDETQSIQENIYALDEQGRPWQYAVDIPFVGECAA